MTPDIVSHDILYEIRQTLWNLEQNLKDKVGILQGEIKSAVKVLEDRLKKIEDALNVNK